MSRESQVLEVIVDVHDFPWKVSTGSGLHLIRKILSRGLRALALAVRVFGEHDWRVLSEDGS